VKTGVLLAGLVLLASGAVGGTMVDPDQWIDLGAERFTE
jgi:hypothetical protein